MTICGPLAELVSNNPELLLPTPIKEPVDISAFRVDKW